MRLKNHPRIQWPPDWSQSDGTQPIGEEGRLKNVDLLGPTELLLDAEVDGKVYFAEINCSNETFARKLYERIKTLSGELIKKIGELEIDV